MAKGQILRSEIKDEYKWDLSTIYKDIDETFDSMRNQIIIVS